MQQQLLVLCPSLQPLARQQRSQASGDASGSPTKKKRRKQGPEGPQKKYKQMQFTGAVAARTVYPAALTCFLGACVLLQHHMTSQSNNELSNTCVCLHPLVARCFLLVVPPVCSH